MVPTARVGRGVPARVGREVTARVGRGVTARVGRVMACLAMLVVAVSVAATPPAAADEITVSDRIVNGVPIPIEDAPWQVALILVDDSQSPPAFAQFCGGSLISDEWVITAAHCLDPVQGSGEPLGPGDFSVLVGVADLNAVTSGNVFDVAAATQHPRWNPSTDQNDVALIRLATAVDLDSSPATPIELPWWQDPGTWPADGAAAEISGWGNTAANGPPSFPAELQLADIDVLASPIDPVCGRYESLYKGSSMLCAADLQAGVDSCQGDSGGPLATIGNGEPRLAGITSFGVGCANGTDPGVYARVTNYLDWIDALTGLGPDGWTASLVGVQPARLYESRPGLRTVDGLQQTSRRVPAGTVVEVDVADRGEVDADAVAALVNVVAVRPSGPGFLTLFPCASSPQPPQGRPGSSTLNYRGGDVVANGALVRIGVGGRICVYTHRDADLVFDVTGYVPLGGSGVGLRPSRLLETRVGLPTIDGVPATVNGVELPPGRVAAGSTIEVQVAGRGGVPVDALAAWVNVAAVAPDQQGFLTLYPCGSARPTASTLNYPAGGTVANGALVRLGPDGRVCIFTLRTGDFILDVGGFLPSESPVTGLVPARLLETRAGNATFDDQLAGIGRLPAGGVVRIPVAGRAGIPASAEAATVNAVAINGAAAGFLTLYPCERPRPEASTLNFAAGEVVANGAFVPLDATGAICLYAHQPTDAVLDVTGWAPG